MISAQSGQNDADTGEDASNNELNAARIEVNTVYNATIGASLTDQNSGSDYEDLYVVSITNPGIIYFELVFLRNNDVNYVNNYLEVQLEYFTTNFKIFDISKYGYDQIIIYEIPIKYRDDILIRFTSYNDLVAYQFKVSFEKQEINTDQNDAGSGLDASADYPITLSLDQQYTGTIGNGFIESSGRLDQTDYYLITAPEQGYIYYNFTGSYNDNLWEITEFNVYFHNQSDGGGQIRNEVIYYQSSSGTYFRSAAPIAKTYLFEIKTLCAWNYTIKIWFEAEYIAEQNDMGTGSDANGFDYESDLLTIGQSGYGHIGPEYYDDEYNIDWIDRYYIDLQQIYEVTIKLKITREPYFHDPSEDSSNSMQFNIISSYYDYLVDMDDYFSPTLSVKLTLTPGRYELLIYGYLKINYFMNITGSIFVESHDEPEIQTEYQTEEAFLPLRAWFAGLVTLPILQKQRKIKFY
ncbi:MAG: hypothetical protein INQ03_20370 [Candidatus Heimdallarchaeota archaeon]|nr:hypothetical protein [Candidatus Heimdallarchaeota archaeon]